jgi:uncharacterized protein
MRNFTVLGCVLAATALATAAPTIVRAASFDCAKAKSRSEVLICGDAELSTLDSQMMADYRATLAVTPRPVAERLAQRAWVADRDKGEPTNQVGQFRPLTADEMKNDYRNRLKEMGEERALIAKARAMIVRLPDLGVACVPLSDAKTCKVESFGQIKGPASLGPLFFQVQGPASDDDFMRGVVVFEAVGPDQLRPLIWEFEEGTHYGDPELVKSKDGWLLHLQATEDGTGVFNADMLFHKVDGRWRDIDITTWSADLAKRLPKDRQVWKGVFYDFAKLETTTGLWKPDDGNCCPTAGHADLTFKIVGDKMEIASLKLGKGND